MDDCFMEQPLYEMVAIQDVASLDLAFLKRGRVVMVSSGFNHFGASVSLRGSYLSRTFLPSQIISIENRLVGIH